VAEFLGFMWFNQFHLKSSYTCLKQLLHTFCSCLSPELFWIASLWYTNCWIIFSLHGVLLIYSRHHYVSLNYPMPIKHSLSMSNNVWKNHASLPRTGGRDILTL
jgi:hypothetical protein